MSQRPIAVHALERRVTSDRGVSKLRKVLRDRVRVHSGTGEVPMPTLNEDSVVSTFCQDTVYPVKTVDIDEKLLRKYGSRVADAVLESSNTR